MHHHHCDDYDSSAAKLAGLLTGNISDKHALTHTLTLIRRVPRGSSSAADKQNQQLNPVQEQTVRLGTKTEIGERRDEKKGRLDWKVKIF